MTDKNGTRFAAVRWIAAMVLVSGTAFLSGATTASPESGVPASEPEAGRGEYVYAGEQGVADTLVIEISDKGKSIVLNGNASVGMEVLAGDLSAVKADIAVIRAEEDTPMGTIADIKQLLRKSGILKLIYAVPDQDSRRPSDAMVKRLPPLFTDKMEAEGKAEAVLIEHRDQLVSVRVNKNGEINVQYCGEQRTGDCNTDFSEMLAGIIGSNPKVYVSVQVDTETGYEAYRYAVDQIDKAYRMARNDYSMSRFGKPFGQLTKEDAEAVVAEIPLRVSEAEPHTTR